MSAKKHLPVAHMFAKTLQFDRADELGRLKRGPNVVRRHLAKISNQERAVSHKRIFSFLLGVSFIRRCTRSGGRIDELIVARPERKLINQVLRFDQVDRRMPRTFDALVAQIKRDLGSAMSLVGDHEQFLSELGFVLIANPLHFRGQRFPTTPTITWIGPDKMNYLQQTQDAGA